jgi:putative heme-binding domain-containing protein
MSSGNTYRFKADGSHVEYFTNGQVNPFGLCFDPLGNIYSCDCHSRPIYQLLRGAFYPSFGRPHDGLGFGPEMMTHSHGSTAIAGITYYAADNFPPEFRDNILIGNVVTNRVNRDTLKKHGSTYLAVEAPDFIRSDDPWFRPVDIKLGPDGALYIADFYNRIIGHYEVRLDHPGRDKTRGRIWRVFYRGKDGKPAGTPAPRWDFAKATGTDLAHDLAHPNLMVRMTAMNELVDRGDEDSKDAIRRVLRRPTNSFQRVHGMWALERLGDQSSVSLAGSAHGVDALVRVHALRVLGERAWKTGMDRATTFFIGKCSDDSDPFVRRTAAEVMGRHPDPHFFLKWLLSMRREVPADDTHQLHAIRMALRDHLLLKQTWEKYQDAEWNDADCRALADVCPGVPSQDAASFLLANLPRLNEQPGRVLDYVHHIARYGKAGSGAAVRAFAETKHSNNLVFQSALVRAMREGTEARGSKLDDADRRWGGELAAKLLAAKERPQIQAGIELAQALRLEAAQDRLTALLTTKSAPRELREAAGGALAVINPPRPVQALGRILGDAAEPLALREHVAGTLAGTNQSRALEELAKTLSSAPAPLQNAIAQALARSRPGAEKLLDAVAAGKASARLLQEPAVRARLEQAHLSDLGKRLGKLTHGLPTADQRLQDILHKRAAGFAKARADVNAGFKVFEKNCAACHQIANNGAKIAPQLDGVGARGVERLLEDILDPSRNVDQAFRATTLTLTNGQILSGLVLREEGAVIVLADAQGKEQRIPKETVEERVVSQLSPMPADFTEKLSEPELYDLLAYLLEQRAPVKTLYKSK